MRDEEITGLQVQVDELAGVEAYATVITELEARLTSLAAAEQRVERIRNLFERVKVVKDVWNKAVAISDLLGPVSLRLAAVDDLVKRVDKNKALSLLYGKVVNLKLSLSHQSKLQELLKPIDLSVIPILVDKVLTLKQIKDLATRVSRNRNELVNKTNELAQVEQQHKATAKEYGDMLRDNGVCPTCNQSTCNLCV
jgi:DNA repair exonuclease SbcCD ATPase subunit